MVRRSLSLQRPASASRQLEPSRHLAHAMCAALHHCQMCSAPASPSPQRGQGPKWEGRVSKLFLLSSLLMRCACSLREEGIMRAGRQAQELSVIPGWTQSVHQAMPSRRRHHLPLRLGRGSAKQVVPVEPRTRDIFMELFESCPSIAPDQAERRKGGARDVSRQSCCVLPPGPAIPNRPREPIS